MVHAPLSRPVIGIVGGIGSGKTSVASMFGDLGCLVIDADRIGHQLLGRPDIAEALVRRFGCEILEDDGSVDRRELGRRAFADESSLADLNAIMHPALRAELVRGIEDFRKGSSPAAVLDAALLFETDWYELCDVIVYVEAPLPVRRQRVTDSRGWSDQGLLQREKLQKPLDFKRAKSHYVVVNNSSVPHLHQQVCLLYHRLIHPADR